jgi:hypothetical protein
MTLLPVLSACIFVNSDGNCWVKKVFIWFTLFHNEKPNVIWMRAFLFIIISMLTISLLIINVVAHSKDWFCYSYFSFVLLLRRLRVVTKKPLLLIWLTFLDVVIARHYFSRLCTSTQVLSEPPIDELWSILNSLF